MRRSGVVSDAGKHKRLVRGVFGAWVRQHPGPGPRTGCRDRPCRW